jgi:hypothetical protein
MIKAIIDFYSSVFADLYEFIAAFWNLVEPFIFAFAVAIFLAMLIMLCATMIG